MPKSGMLEQQIRDAFNDIHDSLPKAGKEGNRLSYQLAFPPCAYAGVTASIRITPLRKIHVRFHFDMGWSDEEIRERLRTEIAAVAGL